jgi:hypothetical protein
MPYQPEAQARANVAPDEARPSLALRAGINTPSTTTFVTIYYCRQAPLPRSARICAARLASSTVSNAA